MKFVIRKLACLVYIVCSVKLGSSATGVTLSLNGKNILDHGIVTIDDIGNTNFDSLLCTTDLEVCCDNERLGNWHYPNYNLVRSQRDSSNHNFFVSRGTNVLRLHRKPRPVSEEGIFRCEVPDSASYPSNEVVMVGIYGHNRGFPEIYDISIDRNSRTINCYTKGGPVTSFAWTKNDEIRPLASGGAYNQFKSIFDYRNAKYVVSLRGNSESDLIGSFACSVRNAAGFNERQIVVNSDFSSSVEKGCGSLATLSNGNMRFSKGFEVGSQVTYTCNPGYEVINMAVVRCLDMGRNGQWTGGRYPYCGKSNDCPIGFSSPNMIVQYTNRFHENSTATFKCESNYNLVGDPNPRTCQKGNWDGIGPRCERIQCNTRFDPPHGFVSLLNASAVSHVVGAVVKYTCFDSYTMVGDEMSACLGSGSWSHEAPICSPTDSVMSNRLCGNIAPGPNMVVKYTSTQALFTCSKGYKMTSNHHIVTCDIASGNWTYNTMPKCTAGAKHLSVTLSTFCMVILVILAMFLKQ